MDRTSYHALLQASKNPQTAADTLAELAKEENYLIRKNVAAHLKTSAGVLWLLVSDKDYTVKKQVAKHPSTPDGVLHLMAVDASNPNTPLEVALLLNPSPTQD